MEAAIYDLGIIDYSSAVEYQKKVFIKVKEGSLPGALILCRHFPVITLGRNSQSKNILFSAESLMQQGIPIHRVDRGGDVTYHGPGQLTAYPVFNLAFLKKDIHFFLRQLEKVAFRALADFGVRGVAREGLTGVWIGKEKIASIGIAVKNWITYHGLSINVLEADLVNFRAIRPCGMDIKATSLESQLGGRPVEMERFKAALRGKFKEVFNFSSK